MGYYKQQEISEQERVDDIIRWWKSHEGQPMPLYLMSTIVEDAHFFAKVLDKWESHIEVSLGTKRMTRKQSEAILRDRKRRLFWMMDWRETRMITIALFTSLIVNISAILYIAAVSS